MELSHNSFPAKKKPSNTLNAMDLKVYFLEATPRFELGNKGLADLDSYALPSSIFSRFELRTLLRGRCRGRSQFLLCVYILYYNWVRISPIIISYVS